MPIGVQECHSEDTAWNEQYTLESAASQRFGMILQETYCFTTIVIPVQISSLKAYIFKQQGKILKWLYKVFERPRRFVLCNPHPPSCGLPALAPQSPFPPTCVGPVWGLLVCILGLRQQGGLSGLSLVTDGNCVILHTALLSDSNLVLIAIVTWRLSAFQGFG